MQVAGGACPSPSSTECLDHTHSFSRGNIWSAFTTFGPRSRYQTKIRFVVSPPLSRRSSRCKSVPCGVNYQMAWAHCSRTWRLLLLHHYIATYSAPRRLSFVHRGVFLKFLNVARCGLKGYKCVAATYKYIQKSDAEIVNVRMSSNTTY